MTRFKENVLGFVQSIPRGQVVSYGQVAAAAGSPRAARQVGGVLRGLPVDTQVPWWRVVNRDGHLSIRGNWQATQELQKQLLEQDGVAVSDSFYVDMHRHRKRS